ncbi:MAG: M20 family metallopeptidase [Anaerolineae bacterium]
MDQLIDFLKARQVEMLDTLAGWVNHDSPTYHKTEVDALGRRIARAFTEAGARLEVHPQPERGDHYSLTWAPAGATGQILLLGHFDTVWPMGEAGKRPFTVSNGRATGPGVYDMKGGLVIGLYAFQALIRLERTLKKRLVFILNSDEEIGSPTSRHLIEEAARRSDYCLVLEPSRGGSLTVWRKGVARFELKVTGLASHSGVDHEKGISAIEELARQVQYLHSLTDYERGTTVNVGLVKGGSAVNVVAANAQAHIDARVKTEEEAGRIVSTILNLKPTLPGVKVEVSGGLNRPPFAQTPASQAMFAQAQAVAAGLGFEVGSTGSGGGSDGNFAAAQGVPTLDGLGPVGGGAHALSEHILVDSLPQRAALVAGLVLALGG